MTTHLPERLRELADEAPGPLSPVGLWQEGRRRHRSRVVTVACAVAAVVALTGGAWYGDWHSGKPDPAAPPATHSGPMRIPDRFYQPSPWLPSTDKPGRLVAILPDIEQHHVFGGPTQGVVGVAAGSQRYSFLDLPDAAPEPAVALAPDGLHLAYSVTGPTSHTPELADPETGVAILDLVSGKVELHHVPSELGLNTVELAWAGRHLLMYANRGLVTRDGSHHYPGTVVDFEVGRAAGATLGVRDIPDVGDTLAAPGVIASTSDTRRLRIWDPESGRHSVIRLSRDLGFGGAMSRDLGSVAAIVGHRSPGPLAVGRVVHGRATLYRVPGGGSFHDPLAWSDSRHVIVYRASRSEDDLVRIDVDTGAVDRLAQTHVQAELAQDAAYAADVEHAVAPPQPWNRRKLAVLLPIVIILVAGGSWLVVRGRRRAFR